MTANADHRFATLDGLRGVAALAVVLFHAGALSVVPMPSGFLAVDLFFVLSGFVMAEVYGRRLSIGLSPGAFLRLRVIRLYPLYLVGAVLGVAVVVATSTWRGEMMPWSALLGVVMLPTPGPATSYSFPINIPAWSLFSEMAVNIVFAYWPGAGHSGYCWVSRPCWAFAWPSPLTVRPRAGERFGSIHVGLLRASYGFTVGMAIRQVWQRSRLSIVTDWALCLPLALVLVLAVPYGSLATQAIVLIGMPGLVALGACIEPRKRGVLLAAGALSYALYCTHGPLLNFARFLAIRSDHPEIIVGSAICGLLMLAWCLDRFYDPPARRALARIWRKHERE